MVDAFGHGPGGHNIVHYPFRKRLWHLMQFHKLSNTVENVVIFGRCGGHLLDDSRHMSKNSGIEQRWKLKFKTLDYNKTTKPFSLQGCTETAWWLTCIHMNACFDSNLRMKMQQKKSGDCLMTARQPLDNHLTAWWPPYNHLTTALS